VDAHAAESLLGSAEKARQKLRGPDGSAAQVQLEEIYPDLRAAFEFFLAAGRSEDALRRRAGRLSGSMRRERPGANPAED
jgi:hypothetical protein